MRSARLPPPECGDLRGSGRSLHSLRGGRAAAARRRRQRFARQLLVANVPEHCEVELFALSRDEWHGARGEGQDENRALHRLLHLEKGPYPFATCTEKVVRPFFVNGRTSAVS